MITQNLKQTQNNIAEAAKKSGRTSDDILLVAVSKTKPLSALQEAYNKEHGITPKTIEKSVRDLISISKKVAKEEIEFKKDPESMSREELEKLIKDVKKQMDRAAADLNFEAAAELRDKMLDLRRMVEEIKQDSGKKG